MKKFLPTLFFLGLLIASIGVTTVYAQLGDTQTASGVVNAATSFSVNASTDFTLDNLSTSYDPSDPRAPAGVLTATGTFTNQSATNYDGVFFEVTDISGGNEILNSDGGSGGVGSTISSGQDVPSGGVLNQIFEIGLQVLQPFQFLWDIFGTPN